MKPYEEYKQTLTKDKKSKAMAQVLNRYSCCSTTNQRFGALIFTRWIWIIFI